MEWYWYVLIITASAMISAVVSASFCIFEKVFRGNREKADEIIAEARKNPDPNVQMRVQTYDRMQEMPHDRLTLLSADGVRLSARYYPNGDSKNIAVTVHGWRSAPWWDYGGTFEMLYRNGYAVLAVSQRALFESEGRYVTYGVREKEDIAGWIDLLLKRYGSDRNIALCGVSMGAATVLMASGNALPEQVKCIVSDCSYTNAAALFRHTSKGWLPVSRLTVDLVVRARCGVSYFKADAVKAVMQSHTPTLFIHGDADEVVPYDMMGKLYAACAAPKEQWTVSGAQHGEAYATDPDGYAQRVLPFLARYMGSGK